MGSAVHALLLDAVGTVIRLREPPVRVYARIAESHGIGVDTAQLERRLRAQLARPPSLALDGLQLSEVPKREREGWRSVVREALGDTAAALEKIHTWPASSSMIVGLSCASVVALSSRIVGRGTRPLRWS